MSKAFLYTIVRERMEQELLSKAQPGDFLPPLAELCRRFEASTITVNRVLRELAAEGRLERIKHIGTRVAKPRAVSVATAAKHRIRLLSTFPQRWMIMQIIEQKMVEFCRYHPQYELQCEYAFRNEQLERLKLYDYDIIIADSGQTRLMLADPALTGRLLPLDKIPSLYFKTSDFNPAVVRHGQDAQGRQYGMALVAGPNLQLINQTASQASQMESFSHYWSAWFAQLRNCQNKRQPLLDWPLDWRYLESVFRMHGIDFFDPDMQYCALDTPEVRTLLEEMVYYLHREQLGLMSYSSPGLLDEVRDNTLVHSRTPLKIASLIFLRPGVNCARFKVRCLPQARKKAAWLFWEGVLVGKNCDPGLAAELLNYFQSAAVQSSLLGCTGLPARLDMQQLALVSYEPEFPGITEAFNQSMAVAANDYPVPYPVLQELNRYFRTVLCGLEPVKHELRKTARHINNLLQAR